MTDVRRVVQRGTLPVILVLMVVAFWASGEFQTIAAGVAIFMFGMLMLEEGFGLFGGGILERVLARATKSLPRSLSFGFVTTTLMQSSTLVTVISISFLSAGMIVLFAGVGIIFGANLGSTTGAWLVAGLGLRVNIAAFALPILALAIVLVFQKSKPLKGGGYVLGGIGFLFLGIHYMKEGFDAFAEQFDLTRFAMTGIAGLLVYTLIGVLMTTVMQSSHATLTIAITALAANQVTFENALAIAIGANLGSTVTAVLGAMTANYQGKRLAGAHVAFNIVLTTMALSFIIPLRTLVGWFSGLVGIAADDYTLQLAVFHTLINIITLMIMIPAIPLLLRALERMFPAVEPDVSQPRYLSKAVSSFPATLQAAVAKEVEHLYGNAGDLIAAGLNLDRRELLAAEDLDGYVDSATTVVDVDYDAVYEARVKGLYGAVLEFVSRSTGGEVPAEVAERLSELRISAERIVRAVKEVKRLRRNTSRFTSVDVGVATTLYNELRRDVARILVELDDLAGADPQTRSILWLEEERAKVRKEKKLLRPLVEELLRAGSLDPATATSFINDANYAYRAMKELLEGAQGLYTDPDGVMAQVERLLAMDEDDLENEDDDG